MPLRLFGRSINNEQEKSSEAYRPHYNIPVLPRTGIVVLADKDSCEHLINARYVVRGWVVGTVMFIKFSDGEVVDYQFNKVSEANSVLEGITRASGR